MNTNSKIQSRARRHKKIRAKLSGTAARPRLSVFKSNKFIYAQLINDDASQTLAAAKGQDAREVGEKIAKLALASKLSAVVFDRGGYLYTGKVSTLAESARKAGLKF